MTTTAKITLALFALALIIPSGAQAAAEGAIDQETLFSSVNKPVLEGTAEDAKTVRILIEDEDGKDVFRSKKLRIKNGDWKVRITKKLPAGEYDVTLYGSSVKKQTLDKETLSILPKNVEKGDTILGGTLVVSPIPLLMGGTAARGASVPVAYVKVSNPGTKAAAINGFRLVDRGSVNESSAVIGFSTSDDKGGSRTTSYTTFKNEYALVPLAATIEPGTFRIFTIKAILASAGSFYGKTLQIDVEGIGSASEVKGAFPMKGTTFTFVY